MALQMSFTAEDGTVYPECYVSLVTVVATLDEALVNVNYYADRASFENHAASLQLRSFQTDVDSLQGNVIPAAYAYLLTLPDFAGAIEVP